MLNRAVRLYLLSRSSFHFDGITVGGQGQTEVHIYELVQFATVPSNYVNF